MKIYIKPLGQLRGESFPKLLLTETCKNIIVYDYYIPAINCNNINSSRNSLGNRKTISISGFKTLVLKEKNTSNSKL